jgi:membrane-associated phospholipid phosphatase
MLLIPPSLHDSTRPTWRDVLRGLAVGAIAPAVVLWLLITGLGEILVGPLKAWNHSESNLNRSLQQTRDAFWDNITAVWSHIGNTEIVIGVCVLSVALIWWRTRRWWFAVIPAIAISLQAVVFVIATAVTGRPRPDVPHLDPAPPTSSYPSGHVGASVALYVSLALMATSIERPWLRRTVIGVCSIVPVLVAYARLYRGMHHLSDVIVGAANGLVCAELAVRCLAGRRHSGRDRTSSGTRSVQYRP